MLLMFFVFGLASLTGQIVLLREILVIFHGTEISIGIFLGTWLAGIGVGASTGAFFARRANREDFRTFFFYALAALGFSLIVQVIIIRLIPAIFGVSPAELTPLSGILVAVPVGTFGTAFLTGFLFPIGSKCVRGPDDRFIARMYAVEALGSLIGGLTLTFVFLRFLSPTHIAALMALFIASAVVLCGWRFKLRGPLISGLALALLGVALLSPIGRYASDWSVKSRWGALHPGLKLMISQPTRYQQVEVGLLAKQFSLFGNGKIVTSFPDPYTSDRMAALIMAQDPQAKRILLIGGGIGSFLGSLLQYPVERVDVVEPDPAVLDIASRYFAPSEAKALEDPRVRMIFSDGRFYVNRLSANEYDVVVCTMPDPVSSFWNRYYTLEFFQSISRAVGPRGILVTGVTSAENFWGAEVASYAGSIYHTLRQVFPVVQGTPGDSTLFFASSAADVISLDPEILRDRYLSLGAVPFNPDAFATILPVARTKFVLDQLERSPSVINTDLTPISSSLAMILWGRFSGSDWMGVLNTVRRGGMTVYLIPIIFFLVARIGFRCRWGQRAGAEARFRALLAVAGVGAGAMGVQIVLIYSYQSLFGYVFERIGLLAGLFMAGLAAGSYVTGRVLPRIEAKEKVLALVLLIFGLFCLLLTPGLQLLAGYKPWLIELSICALVLVSGMLTGVPFPLAASRHLELTGNAGVTSGWTDAADHYGAALGAVLTGAILFPLLGAGRACVVLAAILVTPVVLIAFEMLFGRIEPAFAKYRPRTRVSFPYVRISWFLCCAVAASFTWHTVVGAPGVSPTVRFSEAELKKVSGSESFTFVDKPYPHYIGSSQTEPGSTVSLSTAPVAGDVRGYGGPINLLLSLSEKGIIRGITLVESRETPSYIKGINDWLAKFRGRSVLEPLHSEVDALTGATISARAVTATLEKTGQRIATPVLGLPEPTRAADSGKLSLDAVKDVRLWATVLLLIFFVFAFHSRLRVLRTISLLASLLVLGFWLNAPFTCLDAVAFLKGEIPARGIVWRNTLFIAVVGISILWGQAFCGFLCPFGALQEILSVKRLRQRASPPVEQAGRYVKFVVLALLLSLALVTDDTVWFYFSPLQHFFRLSMDNWVWALALVSLAASMVYFRFWCRYLCPAGAFFAIFNKISLLRKWSPRPIPSRCDLGVSFPEDVDCIRCHRCLFKDDTSVEQE